ncbi:thioesterase family protein [Demequina sp. SYSU T00039]|uniref:Thioesterase family protein n=1 Tax=Demequina lignilytica TaxID=3051663 RepID=A0AAW7M884_9MICO|nr:MULTISPECIES: thioesterase family protein [unclassified Demequina]MDN4479272.1 thioesterase family protein [Demequina sp. SYSU T00039-1]MDN4487590.1 thioesterase family protein [Demequina sp. SYSU T00039]
MSRIHVPITLRWSDLDAYGHVNNAEMLRLLEEARIRVFWADRSAAEEHEVPHTALIAGGPDAETITLIAAQRIEYLAPIPYLRRPLDVQLWIGRLGGASIEICYEVWSPAGDEPRALYAKAATTLVLIDAESNRPRRLTEAEREAWSPHLDEPVRFRNR